MSDDILPPPATVVVYTAKSLALVVTACLVAYYLGRNSR